MGFRAAWIAMRVPQSFRDAIHERVSSVLILKATKDAHGCHKLIALI